MTDSRAILTLIATVYDAIHARETELGIAFGGGDMRARIERFHDCVRAFTSGQAVDVDTLAYSLRAIHYLSHKPLAQLADASYSATTQLIKKAAQALTSQRSATREDKQFLADCYQRYGVLFSALFNTQADRDMRDRVEEMDEQVSALADVEAMLTQMAQGKGSSASLKGALQGVDEGALKAAVAALTKGGKPTPDIIQKAARKVKAEMKAIDQNIKAVEDAHLAFASSQLALFEEGKAIVKQLAASGLNLAGQFVGNAVQQDNTRGRGR